MESGNIIKTIKFDYQKLINQLVNEGYNSNLLAREGIFDSIFLGALNKEFYAYLAKGLKADYPHLFKERANRKYKKDFARIQ